MEDRNLLEYADRSRKDKSPSKIQSLRLQLKKNKEELLLAEKQIDDEEELILKQRVTIRKKEQFSPQRKINPTSELILPNNDQQSLNIKFRDWDLYNTQSLMIKTKVKSPFEFYPPSCSGYDITYSKYDEAIYVYGGISCTSFLKEGLKQHFYCLKKGAWSEVKPVSMYIPMPRYGHTLTSFHDTLLLVGGVSEYKEKLRDRCFYADLWSYNILKNNWKLIQFTGPMIKNRKNHAACVYQKFYLVCGGIDDSEQVIPNISWTLMDEKKTRWRHKKIDGKYNHKMAILQTQQGYDYLLIFGGRGGDSEIINDFLIFPIHINDGQLNIKQSTKIAHSLCPREVPIMCEFQCGLLIMGGIDKNNEVLEDCWYYSGSKQLFEKFESGIDWKQLRGARATSMNRKRIYLLSGGISQKYKAIEFSQ